MSKLLTLSFLLSSFALPAHADDVPNFLQDKVYSTDVSKCGDSTEDDSLQLSKEGVFGFEFGCTFLGFDMEVDKDTGKTYVAVAKANCGDDSGINRPDLITLIAQDDETVSVQSQNEYIIAETQIQLLQRLPETFETTDEMVDFVSREYKQCK